MKDTKLYFNGCLWPIGAGGGPPHWLGGLDVD